MQVFLLDQGYLSFAGFPTLESVALQALANRYRHAFEFLHGFAAGRSDANPFYAATLREGVQQFLKWGWFRHQRSLVHSGESAPPFDFHEGIKKWKKTHSFEEA